MAGSSRSNQFHQRALQLIRDEYEQIHVVDQLGTDRVNRPRPRAIRYATRDEMIREYWAAANAVARFAVSLGVIGSEEAAIILREFTGRYPELASDE